MLSQPSGEGLGTAGLHFLDRLVLIDQDLLFSAQGVHGQKANAGLSAQVSMGHTHLLSTHYTALGGIGVSSTF